MSVEVVDLGGNVVVDNNISIVNVSLLPPYGNASLLGNSSCVAAAGIATFTNITVDKVGRNYSLFLELQNSQLS